MKIRADEHVSRKIILAIHELILSPGWDLTHVRDFHEARTTDETWIPKFAAEGGVAILSADARLLRRPHQLLAIQESGLICVMLPSKWVESKRHVQAAVLLYHWPAIEAAISKSSAGDCWRVPFEVGRRLEQIRVDYEKAVSAARKKST